MKILTKRFIALCVVFALTVVFIPTLLFATDLSEPSFIDRQNAIISGQTLSGNLSSSNEGDVYTFSAIAGEVVNINLNGNFDTVLHLHLASGQLIVEDDDSGEGLNSLISNYVLPSTANYRIEVKSYQGGGTGSYSVSLNISAGSNGGNSGVFVKPADGVRDYDGSYSGVPGTGNIGYSTLYRDNEDGGRTSGCNGEGCGWHPGVDIPLGFGTEIRAIADGVVDPNISNIGNARNLGLGYNSGWGGLVIIRHDNLPGVNETIYSFYAHLNSFHPSLQNLTVSRTVRRGDVIGYSGGTGANAGNSTGAHLHFQISRSTINSAGIAQVSNFLYFPSNVNARDSNKISDLNTYNPMFFIQNSLGTRPQADRISPLEVSPSTNATITILGSNFDNASDVIVLSSSGQFVGNAAITSRSFGQITVEVFLRDPGNFLLGVRNRDGRVSNHHLLTVRNGGSNNQPDLVVTNLSSSVNATTGQALQNLSVSISNRGNVSAPAFRIGFYFSTDSIITTQDVFSGTICDYTNGLSTNSSSTCTGGVSVPSNLPAGTYYLGAIVDYERLVVESDENNNTRAFGPITINR